MEKICKDCGSTFTESFYTVCDGCREKRRYNSCRKMTIEEYAKEFPDNMVVDSGDKFYPSVEDALENCYGDEESIPYYVYGTEKVYVKVDIERAVENALENALEDAYEDAEFNNLDELYAFVDAWNERNKIVMFDEAKIVIDIPESVRREYIMH